MSERLTDTRTLVGVPFYDGEGAAVLEACLKNIDSCLNILGIDAKIVVGINGPRVCRGEVPLSYQIQRSNYNAEIEFVKTPPGLVNAEKTIGRRAIEEGYKRIFLTDADITRFPRSLLNMWTEGDRPIVGANYSAYPFEILIGHGINFTPQEMAFMRIFEADKHPLAREFTFPHRPAKRLKGSLLLVDTSLVPTMFGYQNITSDSRMNMLIPESDRQLVLDAAFMHYARVDITDHIQARLRHFRAAKAENELETFSRKSLIYEPGTANDIAREIVQKYPEAVGIASDFLLQCALRYWVVEICKTIASGKKYEQGFPTTHPEEINMPSLVVTSFEEAWETVSVLLSGVNLESLSSSVTKGKGITNNRQSRIPLDPEPFLSSPPHRQLILDYLGLKKETAL